MELILNQMQNISHFCLISCTLLRLQECDTPEPVERFPIAMNAAPKLSADAVNHVTGSISLSVSRSERVRV